MESREYEDPKQNTQPGFTMKTNVKPAHAIASADSGGALLPGVVDIANVKTVSDAVLEGSSLTSRVEAVVTGVDLAGGVLHIDTIKTMSTATSDATKSACDGSVAVSGATVGGTPVRIDDKGVHANGQTVVPGADPNAVVAQALAASGVQARVLGGTGACQGPSANRSTAGVLVSVPAPCGGGHPTRRKAEHHPRRDDGVSVGHTAVRHRRSRWPRRRSAM